METTSMLVHDLKNPVNSVLQLSKEEKVKQAGFVMQNIILNILDVSKAENSKLTLVQNDFLLNTIIDSARTRLSLLLENKNLTIIEKYEENITLDVDFDLIVRTFENLLSNAIKFSPQNEEITIKTTEVNSDYIKISVKDNGEGIAKENIASIFDQYKQVSAKKSGNVKSTGLGLTFCKIAVEAHNGIINIESDTGKGFEIIFTLPRSKIKILPSQNKKIIPSSNKLTLKEEEVILNVVNILKEINIYEASKILKVLKNVDYENSENIETWLSKTKQAVFNANDELYKKMLNI